MAKNKKTRDVNKWLKFRFNLKKRISLYRKLKDYVEEGFPLYESLEKFKHRFDKKNDFRGKIIGEWLYNIKHGDNFSSAVKGWIPEAELNLISSGEEGIGIEVGFREAAKFAQSSQIIKKTIITGSAYPAILFAMILGFVAMFSLKIAPTYQEILPVERWPSLAQNFYAVSKMLTDYWLILVSVIGVATVATYMTIDSWTGKSREIFDKFPPWSVYKIYQASAFLISLASMMQSNISLNDSLKKIKKTTTPWVGKYIDAMLRNLSRGGKNGHNLDVGLLDEETANDVIDYSDLGIFETAIYNIGDNNLAESVVKIESRMAIVRILMIMLVGLTVGIIYYTSIELNSSIAEAAASATQLK